MPRRQAMTQPAPRAVRISRLSEARGCRTPAICYHGRMVAPGSGHGQAGRARPGGGHDAGMSIIMHDLAGADPDVRFSPYCWRTRFALAHKGLPVETVPWRFTEREAIAFSGQGKVPVIRDERDGGASTVGRSRSTWRIRCRRRRCSAGPPGGRTRCSSTAWADGVLVGGDCPVHRARPARRDRPEGSRLFPLQPGGSVRLQPGSGAGRDARIGWRRSGIC